MLARRSTGSAGAGLALVAFAASLAPSAAADGWIEVAAAPATVHGPAVGVGSAVVPAPAFARSRVCAVSEPVPACVAYWTPNGFRDVAAPAPIVSEADYAVPLVRVTGAWSPAAAEVACEAADGNRRAFRVAVAADADGDHAYAAVRDDSWTMTHGNAITAAWIDRACGATGGALASPARVW